MRGHILQENKCARVADDFARRRRIHLLRLHLFQYKILHSLRGRVEDEYRAILLSKPL